MKKVVVVGGGTGTYTVLTGLRDYHLELSVIVSMMDSGGSTGRLRDQFGVLPPGDFRQCLVALSQAPAIWRELFLYRFDAGDLKGHNFGNIFLTTLEKIKDNYKDVTETASLILGTSGKVIPVTYDKTNLGVVYEDGRVVEKEGEIDKSNHSTHKIKNAYLKPQAKANAEALKAIKEADFVIFGPGDLYTSIIPNLLVNGFTYSLAISKAKFIYVCNLMTKKGQTTNYKASDHLRDLEKYLKRKVDHIVINSKALPKNAVEHYKKDGEEAVVDDLQKDHRVYRDNFLSDKLIKKSEVDDVIRSLVRHDSQRLAKGLIKVMEKNETVSTMFKGLMADVKNLLST